MKEFLILVLFVFVRVISATWGGLFEVSDNYCVPCNDPNPETYTCACPAGFAAQTLRTLNDCSGHLHGGNIYGCYTGVTNDGYTGTYQIDDPVPNGLGCRSPNPFTGACSCPANTGEWAYRVIADGAGGNSVGSNIIFCVNTGQLKAQTFAGVYQTNDVNGCRIVNPLTGACSCPAESYPQQVRVIADIPNGLTGGYIVVCGQYMSFDTNVEICPGVVVDRSNTIDASAGINACIANMSSYSTLELPFGNYRIANQIVINKPFTITTQGTGGQSNCETPGVMCAVLYADPALYAVGGILYMTGQYINIDHIIIDGNRINRMGTPAASDCETFNNNRETGFNAYAVNCVACSFTFSVSRYSLCASGLAYMGSQVSIVNSIFRGNGQTPNYVSDGVTALELNYSNVTNCYFIDNSDVNLILGSGVGSRVVGNIVTMLQQYSFAGLMMDNFDNSLPGTYDGFEMTNNNIMCAGAISFGIMVGGRAWYPNCNPITGGIVTQNAISGCGVSVNVMGGGTAADPVTIYDIGYEDSPGDFAFKCGTHPGTQLNIWESVVNRNGESSPPATNLQYCY